MMSCITQLLHAMEHWTKSLDDGNDVDIVYLDFCKAFDCISHQCILFKLKAYGISGNVLNWIMDLLSIYLWYFAWVDQRVQQFYDYHNVSRR